MLDFNYFVYAMLLAIIIAGAVYLYKNRKGD